LLVGINQYPQPGARLKGCVNDVLSTGKLLTENFGFKLDDVRLLVDDRATTAAIRERLGWLVEGAGPGSVLFFHYSGHGSQVRDRDGDELEDTLDEILCPYDLNWDDPFTDDELAKYIARVPDGAVMTLLLDCCHSGTGTREFFKEPALGRSPTLRYLVPPPDVAFRAAAAVEIDAARTERSVSMSGRRRGVTLRRFGAAFTEQNAVLIAGCRSDQTSADAWIENDYHGALTYSVTSALRAGSFSLSNRQLVEDAGTYLETNGYDQVPQLEAPEALHGLTFLGTSQQGSESPAPASAFGWKPLSLAAASRDSVVVWVHGIGDHEPGYSDPWRVAFNRYLELPRESFIEVVWDDVFDRSRSRDFELLHGGALPALTAEEERRAEQVKAALREIVEARMSMLPPPGGESRRAGQPRDRVAERGFGEWVFNFDEYIGDFVKYLVSSSMRDAIDERLVAKLRGPLADGRRVELITHSWGTVVGYHTLSRLERGMVHTHCTLGSPLWMGPVRRLLGLGDGKDHCAWWINVDAEGDVIGGDLSAHFKVDHDFHVPSLGPNPHGSYFVADNTLVQRDIVARAITREA
jgi:hypothetical protein